MFKKQTLAELNAELGEIEAEIASNPLASAQVIKASKTIEELKKDDLSAEAIDSVLAPNELPSLAQIGQVQLQNIAPWAKLHRAKKKTEAKIAKLSR